MANLPGAFPRGVEQLVIGVWNGTTLGTLLDVPSVQAFEVTDSVDTDELIADDVRKYVTITAVGADGSLQVAELDPASRAAMSGGATITNGSGATAVHYFLRPAARTAPYVYLMGLARGAGQPTGTAIGVIPSCLVTGGGFGFTDGPMEATMDLSIQAYDDGTASEPVLYWTEQHANSEYDLPTTGASAIPTVVV